MHRALRSEDWEERRFESEWQPPLFTPDLLVLSLIALLVVLQLFPGGRGVLDRLEARFASIDIVGRYRRGSLVRVSLRSRSAARTDVVIRQTGAAPVERLRQLIAEAARSPRSGTTLP